MRMPVVGAGSIGGLFGGRLAEAGRDVSFLVRSGRAEQLTYEQRVVLEQPVRDCASECKFVVTRLHR
jgi:2-dehydropantoate 2-reductase